MNSKLLEYIVCETHIWEDSWITYTGFQQDRYNKFIDTYNSLIPFWNDKNNIWREISKYHIIVQALIDSCTMFSYCTKEEKSLYWSKANRANKTVYAYIKLWEKNPVDEEWLSFQEFILQHY